MKVSIITVVYNNVNEVGDAVKSVLAQTYADIEYIVVDGGSTDGTKELILSYGNKISKFISEKDKGIYDAMNKGIALATGEVIAFLNADDVYADENSVAHIMATLQDPSIDLAYADLIYLYHDNTKKIKRYWKSGAYHKNDFLYGFMFPHPTVFARKRLFDQYGGFNTTLKVAADYELSLRFVHKYNARVAYLPKVLVKMLAGGASNGNLYNRVNTNREDRLAWTLNGLKPYFFTLYLKPLRKLPQYLFKSVPKDLTL